MCSFPRPKLKKKKKNLDGLGKLSAVILESFCLVKVSVHKERVELPFCGLLFLLIGFTGTLLDTKARVYCFAWTFSSWCCLWDIMVGVFFLLLPYKHIFFFFFHIVNLSIASYDMKLLLQLCGGKSSEGVFVGAFLSMSSTAVVIPCDLLHLRVEWSHISVEWLKEHWDDLSLWICWKLKKHWASYKKKKKKKRKRKKKKCQFEKYWDSYEFRTCCSNIPIVSY